MEKERKVKKLALVAVIVAVLGMTIAFAALSQTLTISGTANTEAAVWDVHFGEISRPILIGTAKADYPYDLATGLGKNKKQKTAIVSSDKTEITDVRATLKKPGDEVRYTTTIENEGTIAAEIASIEMPTLTAEQKEIFDFNVIYTEDGKEVSVGDVLPGYASVDTEECSACSQAITIKVRYKDITDESLLPEGAQSITFSYKINYIQSDKKDLYHAGNMIFGVELSNGQTPVTTGTATAATPTLVGNSLQIPNWTISNIGDKIVYKFDITNLADHAVTVDYNAEETTAFTDEMNVCFDNNLSEHPECTKYDINGDSSFDNEDYNTIIDALDYNLEAIDGNNKISASATKTFALTIEVLNDFPDTLTGDVMKALDGNIYITVN